MSSLPIKDEVSESNNQFYIQIPSVSAMFFFFGKLLFYALSLFSLYNMFLLYKGIGKIKVLNVGLSSIFQIYNLGLIVEGFYLKDKLRYLRSCTS